MASTTATSTLDSIKNTVSDAANYISESVQELTSATSKEANKEVAKDSSVPIADRASAGMDAIGDKIQEEKHSAAGSAYKESAKN